MTTREALTTVRRREGAAVIDLVGDVNSRAEARLDAAWAEATEQEPVAVVLNFSDAGYINSTGIALVVGIMTKARARALPIRAYGLTPHYREIFEITRLADFMAIEDDEDSALDGAEGTTR